MKKYALRDKDSLRKITGLRYLIGLVINDPRHDEMQNVIEDVIHDIQKAGWIKVSSWTPDPMKNVDVTYIDAFAGKRRTAEAYLCDRSGTWRFARSAGTPVDGTVIAWKEKAQPYQGEI